MWLWRVVKRRYAVFFVGLPQGYLDAALMGEGADVVGCADAVCYGDDEFGLGQGAG